MTLPRFSSGGVIKADALNRISAAAETALNAPRQIEEPPPSESQDSDDSAPANFQLNQATITTETVRIEDPDDPDTYVNVQRRVVETFSDQDGKLWRFVRSY